MLHKHEPVPESQMNEASPRNSICETIRGIYHSTDNPAIRLQCRVATAMAKAMSKKLSEKKPNWFWNFWDPNPDNYLRVNDRFRRPIDVLLLAYDDFANTGYRFWMCAKQLGLNAIMFKGKPHPFKYPKQAPVHPSLANTPIGNAPLTVMAPGLESLIRSANVVHLLASTYPMCVVDWTRHGVIVQHGGTYYRQNPEANNELFNQIAHQTIIQCPDLLGLGAKNETLIYYPVDTIMVRPDFSKKGDSLIVGHFPSNPSVKGSDRVYNAVMTAAHRGASVSYRGPLPGQKWGLVGWEENLKRMRECDVIVETCAPEQDGKAYGEWGNTALEAAASGCVIVSNAIHQDTYEKEYGKLGLHVANDPEAVTNELIRLSELPSDKLEAEKRACCAWVEEKHSIPATAERLWNHVYSRYF